MSSPRKQLVSLGVLAAMAAVLAFGWPGSTGQLSAQQPGAKPKAAKKSKYTVPKKDVEAMKALNCTMRFEFKGVPIKEVLDYIEAKCSKAGLDLIFEADKLAFRDAGQNLQLYMNDPVIANYNRPMKIRTFLHIILFQRGLAYYLDDGIVKIAPKEKVDTRLVTRSYPVSNLIGGPRLVKLADDELLRGQKNGPAGQMLGRNIDLLVYKIVGTVAPDDWKLPPANGLGSMKYGSGSLAIKGSLELQYLVIASGLLDNSRAKSARPSKKELETVVVKAHSIAGLLDKKNPQRGQADLTKALGLLMPVDRAPADVAFLTAAEVVVVRQPLAVQLRVEKLLSDIRSSLGHGGKNLNRESGVEPQDGPPELDLRGIDLDSRR